jgi:hypothetical protein
MAGAASFGLLVGTKPLSAAAPTPSEGKSLEETA